MASLNLSPGEGLMLPNLNVDQLSLCTRFLIISLPSNAISSISPFVIQKALIGIGGEPKSVKRLRSGDLLIETLSAIQTQSFLQAKTFLNSPVNIYPHKTLNSCRGIISEPDLLTTTDAEILDGFSGQGVIQNRRITIRRDTLIIPTKHIILTFNSPKLLSTIKAGYLNCRIRPYIPNPLRCFKCQSYLKHAQAAKSSTLNNSTQTDENITKINCPLLKLLAPLSSKQRTNIPTAVTTSSSAQTELLPSISSKTSTTSDPQPPTPMSETKGKIKEQPSQLHRPRKDSKKIDLLSIKPTTNLKKNPVKNTTLKTAREQDSPNETSPVSKKSRRRKTFKTSDAMDTDANPSDFDYVIGLASEEDESLLAADFKKSGR
ncbi:uncharacterized protein TNCV_2378921 [Trichonephila clavipes]|uniref:Uncharacterized protein n=1 Tax=Trichonephila clavipes TaxID=2585209 RepID=A0A8X6RLK7_TRICX|nr:uncharacterized protein TNCV_2378921 [Trichonephila clavipes]